MKIKEALKEKNGSYILEKLLNKDKAWLFLNDNLKVPSEYFEIQKKIKNGYPIEYIFEEVWFYGDKFFIKEGVLIPRDDTEIVVEKAINLINNIKPQNILQGKEKEKMRKREGKDEKNSPFSTQTHTSCMSGKFFHFPLKVVDCCTGSGVIAIEIAKRTNAKVVATDISELALEVAKKNAKIHNVDIEFKKCDLFDIEGDILVANPPYVENSWQKPNKYEPDLAFFGGNDGLDIVKKIIKKAKRLNYKIAIIEIGYNQKENLIEFLNENDCKYEFFKDLEGRIRGVEILFR